VPTIDLHKYWDTLKPIVLTPNLSTYDLSHGHVCSQGAGLRVHGQLSGRCFESKV